jgi:hypothetical protein
MSILNSARSGKFPRHAPSASIGKRDLEGEGFGSTASQEEVRAASVDPDRRFVASSQPHFGSVDGEKGNDRFLAAQAC